MEIKVTPMKQLLREVKRFLEDKNRGISINLFAELCGVDATHLREVFIDNALPLTEYMQRRVSKGFKEWQQGNVAVYEHQDKTRFIKYRRESKPSMTRHSGLQVINGKIKLKLGVKYKADYSGETLDEALKRRT
jgi:hypothetical protein